jgi:calcineurin-like phosphoesterase family protein
MGTSVRWFTSDLHLGHANIIGYCDRPFESVEEMNQALIDNWNSHVADGDTVWVLGDVAMGKLRETLPLVGQLNGHKILLPGNHDRVWKGHAPKKRWLDKVYLDAGFDRIEHGELGVYPLTLGQDLGRRQHGVLLCHFPYTVGQYDGRFSGNHPTDEGLPLLHGHTHSRFRIQGRQIHVGVDSWGYAPVSEEQVIALIEEQM